MNFLDFAHELSDWVRGILSGFPRCCIVWFYLRRPFVPLMVKFGRNTGMSLKQCALSKALTPHRETNYCECPAHAFSYWLNNRRPEWHMCEKCGWMQMGHSKCRLCLYVKGTK